MRGAAQTNDYASAIDDANRAINSEEADWLTLNVLAWLLATTPDAQCRDGARAVECALRACKMTANAEWQVLDTLAAAYAEIGNFPEAIVNTEKALKLCPADEVKEVEARLNLYREGKPYRETSK